MPIAEAIEAHGRLEKCRKVPDDRPALARRTTTPVGDIWVVPGNGWLALWDGSATANRTEVIVRQGMMMWTSSLDGHGIIYGLVPDGVSDVTLVDPNEIALTVPITDNVYGARLDGYFRSLSFIGLTGRVDLGPYF